MVERAWGETKQYNKIFHASGQRMRPNIDQSWSPEKHSYLAPLGERSGVL